MAQAISKHNSKVIKQNQDRCYEHTSHSNNESEMDKTTLNAHICKLKKQGDPYTTSWRIIDIGKAFNPSIKSSQVCLKEKYNIMFSLEGAT